MPNDPKDEALKAIDALIEFGDHTHDCYYYKGGKCDCGRDEAVEQGMKVRQQLIDEAGRRSNANGK